MQIKVTRDASPLLRREWEFAFYVEIGRLIFQFVSFTVFKRQSSRHKFKMHSFYALGNRWATIQIADVEIPDDVIADAREQIKRMIDAKELEMPKK